MEQLAIRFGGTPPPDEGAPPTGNVGAANKHAAVAVCFGAFLALYIVIFSFTATALFLNVFYWLNRWLYYLLNALVLSAAFRTRAAIGAALEYSSDNGHASASGCSDGTQKIAGSLAAELLYGVCAPMLCASIGAFVGMPAAFAAAYRSLAALDKAAGGGEGRYCHIGWAAAKLNDAINFIPSRILGVALPILSLPCGLGLGGAKNGLRASRDAQFIKAGTICGERTNESIVGSALSGAAGIGSNCGTIGKKNSAAAARLVFAASLSVLAACCAALYYAATLAR